MRRPKADSNLQICSSLQPRPKPQMIRRPQLTSVRSLADHSNQIGTKLHSKPHVWDGSSEEKLQSGILFEEVSRHQTRLLQGWAETRSRTRGWQGVFRGSCLQAAVWKLHFSRFGWAKAQKERKKQCYSCRTPAGWMSGVIVIEPAVHKVKRRRMILEISCVFDRCT